MNALLLISSVLFLVTIQFAPSGQQLINSEPFANPDQEETYNYPEYQSDRKSASSARQYSSSSYGTGDASINKISNERVSTRPHRVVVVLSSMKSPGQVVRSGKTSPPKQARVPLPIIQTINQQPQQVEVPQQIYEPPRAEPKFMEKDEQKVYKTDSENQSYQRSQGRTNQQQRIENVERNQQQQIENVQRNQQQQIEYVQPDQPQQNQGDLNENSQQVEQYASDRQQQKGQEHDQNRDRIVYVPVTQPKAQRIEQNSGNRQAAQNQEQNLRAGRRQSSSQQSSSSSSSSYSVPVINADEEASLQRTEDSAGYLQQQYVSADNQEASVQQQQPQQQQQQQQSQQQQSQRQQSQQQQRQQQPQHQHQHHHHHNQHQQVDHAEADHGNIQEKVEVSEHHDQVIEEPTGVTHEQHVHESTKYESKSVTGGENPTNGANVVSREHSRRFNMKSHSSSNSPIHQMDVSGHSSNVNSADDHDTLHRKMHEQAVRQLHRREKQLYTPLEYRPSFSSNPRCICMP